MDRGDHLALEVAEYGPQLAEVSLVAGSVGGDNGGARPGGVQTPVSIGGGGLGSV